MTQVRFQSPTFREELPSQFSNGATNSPEQRDVSWHETASCLPIGQRVSGPLLDASVGRWAEQLPSASTARDSTRRHLALYVDPAARAHAAYTAAGHSAQTAAMLRALGRESAPWENNWLDAYDMTGRAAQRLCKLLSAQASQTRADLRAAVNRISAESKARREEADYYGDEETPSDDSGSYF